MKKGFILAVDLGGTNLKIALFDTKCRIKEKVAVSTKGFLSKEGLTQAIINGIARVIRENKLKKQEISGIGLGLPGPIDVEKGIVHFFPNIPGWKEVISKKY